MAADEEDVTTTPGRLAVAPAILLSVRSLCLYNHGKSGDLAGWAIPCTETVAG